MSSYPTVAFIGSGKVAHRIGPALVERGVKITGVYGRNAEETEKLAAKLNTHANEGIDEPIHADIILVMVNDDAIAETTQALHPDTRALIAHTSGAVSINAIPDRFRRGVFYPLQSFSFDKKVIWENVPFCLEADNDDDLNLLGQLAEAMSERIHLLSSKQRKSLHLAAVFANNFANLMFEFAEDLLEDADIDRSILHPLILETANKILMQTASESQTGPATRGDMETIEAHRQLLGDDNIYRRVYDLLTTEIYNRTHEQNL